MILAQQQQTGLQLYLRLHSNTATEVYQRVEGIHAFRDGKWWEEGRVWSSFLSKILEADEYQLFGHHKGDLLTKASDIYPS